MAKRRYCGEADRRKCRVACLNGGAFKHLNWVAFAAIL